MALSELFSLHVLVPWLLSMIFGILVGATPGLTATMAVALLVPFSFSLDASAGLAMIIGVSFTAIFAGDLPATFLRIPGTPASAAATLDGYAMARQGRGGFAVSLNLVCSVIGGLFGVTLLIIVAPQLAKVAIKFSHFERFWLAILGLCLSAAVSSGRLRKGLLAAVLGMLIATVGIDAAAGGTQRFTFGLTELTQGIGFIPVMIGLFGLSEVLRSLTKDRGEQSTPVSAPEKVSWFTVLATVWRRKATVVKGACTGSAVGALPGAGADVAAWASYGLAQRTSKRGSAFGTGVEEGVIAPTSANNAAVAGAWIPALVLGIPGDAVTAMVLGALMMHAITPGPEIFTNHAAEVQTIFTIALLTQLLLLVAGIVGIRSFGYIMRLPRRHLYTGVVVFSVVGAYALRNSLFDVWVMVLAGLLGFFLDRHQVPLPPLILGLILGPMAEKNLRSGLISSKGELTPMFTQPICALLITLLLAILILPTILRSRRRPDPTT